MQVHPGLINANGAFDSSKVSVHVTLVHGLEEEGEYICQLTDGAGARRHVHVTVGGSSLPAQADIDCQAQFDAGSEPMTVAIRAAGYLVFDSGFGDGQFEVKIEHEGSLIFDSQEIGHGSMIVISPLVPGSYSIKDQISGVEAVLDVRELAGHVGNEESMAAVTAYQKLQEEGPRRVSLDGDRFEPSEIVLVADQPMTLTGEGPMRVVGSRSDE